MKKIIYILLFSFSLITMFSCSEDAMDAVNTNTDNSTTMASKFIITDAMTGTAFNTVGTDLCFYSSVYIEHNVGVYGQMYNAEIRSGEPTSTSTYDNAWSATYNNLYNLKDVITKCSSGGSEEGNYHTLGIAQVLTAYNLAVLTDCFGDVPWTQALQPGVYFQPELDSQEDIYNDIFVLLDSAVVNLNKTSEYSDLGSQDLIYGGTSSSWIKFAYGLMARYTMRLSYRDAEYQKVIDYVDESFSSSDEEAKFAYNASTSYSPYYSFLEDRNYFGASTSFDEKLSERGDPREEIFYGDLDDLVLAPNGTPDQKQDYYTKSQISTATAPTYLLSYHELLFLKAEAYARLGELSNAQEALKDAIVAACSKSNIAVDSDEATSYADDIIAEYATSVSSALQEIMIQKYIAFYEEESLEAYNDYRRLKAMGESFVTLDNTLNSSKFPLRFVYGSSDATTNTNISSIVGDGTYVYTDNVWWAGGSY